jgi:putative ABC transport system substrate-binding protein
MNSTQNIQKHSARYLALIAWHSIQWLAFCCSLSGKLVLALAFAAQFGGLEVRAHAQERAKIPRIAFLYASVVPEGGGPTQIKKALRELGYVEGKNIGFEYRHAEGKLDRLAALAAELVRLKMDVILTGGSTATRAAKAASPTIPIVMLQDNDPVRSGFIESLARPGGNITGLSTVRPEVSGKRLELLREVVPGLSQVAVLGSSTNPGNSEGLKQTELAAQALKVKIEYIDVRALKEMDGAFRAARSGSADGVLVLGGPIFNVNPKLVAEAAIKSRLPAVFVRQNFVNAGGLMSYGVNLADLQRRAAIYVDKILKGAKPEELPVEQPTKFELLINLKTAKQIGLTIPPQVLARADRVIK